MRVSILALELENNRQQAFPLGLQHGALAPRSVPPPPPVHCRPVEAPAAPTA